MPSDSTPEAAAGKPPRLAILVRWRSWRLPVKLAAVTAVPVLLALALGVLTVRAQVERSAVYQRSDRLVALGEEVLTLASGLQAERNASARQLATGPVADPAGLRPPREAVDTALIVVGSARAELVRPSAAITARLAEADRRIERLRPLREQVTGGTPGLDAVAAIGEYGVIVHGLLELDRVLASDIAAAELARTATALHDLAEAGEQLALQRDLVAVGIARGSMGTGELNALRASSVRLTDRLDDFRAAASPEQLDDYRRMVAGPDVDARDQQVRRLLDEPPGSPLPAAAEWDGESAATIWLTAQVTKRIAEPLGDASAALQARASNRAGLASVLLFVAFVLAAAVGVAVTRQLLGSLGMLRRSALEVAEHGLPAAVATIRNGGRPDTIAAPVPVQTTEDVGQLASAFDAVHRQALRLAADEAILRSGYGAVFVNLSRRSQGLVQRQLQLLERLERDEEDAEQLATLFQLDHLATRMRRNNENLMVLSGSDVARRATEPAPLADLLRAAISEIEHYQRVELRPAPPVQVVGNAAGDLVRLIAELLDNATAFSPPDSQVTVAAHRSDSGCVVVNVLDQGIGMSDEEIADANARLRATGPVDLPPSRRMGIFVVGRLAGRHAFEVRLHGGKDLQGVQATITVPPELVAVPGQAAIPAPPWQPPPGSPVSVHPPSAELPSPAYAAAGALDGEPRPVGDAGAVGTVGAVGRPGAVGEVGAVGRAGAVGEGAAVGEDVAIGTAGDVGEVATGQVGAIGHGGAVGELPRRTRGANSSPRRAAPTNGVAGQQPTVGDWPSWWDTSAPPAAAAPPARPVAETTPIFDQMLSAWFAVPGSPSNLPPADPDTATDQDAANQNADSSRANAGRNAAAGRDTVADGNAAGNGNAAGLAQGPAINGSGRSTAAGNSAAGAVASSDRSAGRLDGPDDELGAGRRSGGTRNPVGVPAEPAVAAPAAATPAAAAAVTPATPARRATPDTRPTAPDDGRWRSAADDGWQAVRALADVVPSEYTAAGLPKRNPRQSLLPGSVVVQPHGPAGGTAQAVTTQAVTAQAVTAPAVTAQAVTAPAVTAPAVTAPAVTAPAVTAPAVTAPAVTKRDAADLRARLNSLRDGLSRGRHHVHKPQANGVEPAPEQSA